MTKSMTVTMKPEALEANNPTNPNDTLNRRQVATLHRFFSQEVRPVRFGMTEDASLSILLCILVIPSLHLFFYYVLGPFNIGGFQKSWTEYTSSNQFLVGLLLDVWVVGYNIVSWVIYYQFERNDQYPADDHYVEVSNQCEREMEGEHDFCNCRPVLFELPDSSLALGIMEND